jgi:hypothetical protein
MITYQKESFRPLIDELHGIIEIHWEEVALDREAIPLNPWWDKYLRLELEGILHVLTVRDSGRLVGYYFGLVCPHLHYAQSITGHTDIFYLDPEYRTGYTGIKLFIEAEKMLRRLNVQKMYIANKVHSTVHGRKQTLDMEPMFTRLGFRFIEKHYAKLL